jgi:light-regulated signal transduction histidine kinase (bacteriophytochrome)
MSVNDKRYVEKVLKEYKEKEVTKLDELKALVKKVIDIIGGSISVESKLNEGTTFIVTVKEN